MYSALFHHFGGRQEKTEAVLLLQLLPVKKSAGNQPMWIAHLKVQHHIRKHNFFFLKKPSGFKLEAASRCFNTGTFINISSLYCLQANGYRQVIIYKFLLHGRNQDLLPPAHAITRAKFQIPASKLFSFLAEKKLSLQ